MSIMIRIPTPLRKMTNGLAKVEMDSANLGELVDQSGTRSGSEIWRLLSRPFS